MTNEIVSALDEILPFLDVLTPVDYKLQIIEHILGMTGTSDGVKAISKHIKLLDKFNKLICYDKNEKVRLESLKVLVNLTSSNPDESLQKKLLDKNFVRYMLQLLILENADCADIVAMLLSNISRSEESCMIILQCIKEDGMLNFSKIVDSFCDSNHNNVCDLHHIGSLLANLTLLKEVRSIFMSNDCSILHRLFPFTQYAKSVVRRLAIARIIKNCLFEAEYHSILLSEDIDIIPSLLLPLAGPEEFTESENDELHIDLQYLPNDKKREENKEVMILLLESLFQLCATKECRLKMKNNGSYYILRELHKCIEAEDKVMQPLENLVQILIGDEPEEGLENLAEIEVPEHLEKKFLNTIHTQNEA